MPTYLFDLSIRGLVDADNEIDAEAILENITKGTEDIYVDEIADVTVMRLRPPRQEASGG